MTHTTQMLGLLNQDPYCTNAIGDDPLISAGVTGRLDNIKAWLRHFPEWDLGKKKKTFLNFLEKLEFFGKIGRRTKVSSCGRMMELRASRP